MRWIFGSVTVFSGWWHACLLYSWAQAVRWKDSQGQLIPRLGKRVTTFLSYSFISDKQACNLGTRGKTRIEKSPMKTHAGVYFVILYFGKKMHGINQTNGVDNNNANMWPNNLIIWLHFSAHINSPAMTLQFYNIS